MAKELSVMNIEHVALHSSPAALPFQTMGDDELMQLLGQAGGNEGANSDEVIEPVYVAPQNSDLQELLAGIDLNIATAPAASAIQVIEPTVNIDDILESAIAAAENSEVSIANAKVEVVNPGAVPTTKADGSDAYDANAEKTAADILSELETVVLANSEPQAETEPEKEQGDKAAADPVQKTKRVTAPRKHYTDKVERLKDRVGDDLSGVSMLSTEDMNLDPTEALDRTLSIIKGMNKKEQNRASNLVEFVTGKRDKPNTVIERLLRLLHADGQLSTGDKGNVMANLLAKPYSPTSARAMGANTVAVFADLLLVKSDGKGKFVSNPESVLLAICKQKLGLQ